MGLSPCALATAICMNLHESGAFLAVQILLFSVQHTPCCCFFLRAPPFDLHAGARTSPRAPAAAVAGNDDRGIIPVQCHVGRSPI